MRYKTDVKTKINFEKMNSADSSIIILKQITSLFSSVDDEKENQRKVVSKIKKVVI